jgi:hypothetical protein
LDYVANWCDSCILPKQTAPRRRVSLDEANAAARVHLRRNPKLAARELAAKIGCSSGLVCKLPAWQAVEQKRKSLRGSKRPKAVRLPKNGDIGEGRSNRAAQRDKDLVLNELIAEQNADYEPSPLEDDPPERRRRVIAKRQV